MKKLLLGSLVGFILFVSLLAVSFIIVVASHSSGIFERIGDKGSERLLLIHATVFIILALLLIALLLVTIRKAHRERLHNDHLFTVYRSVLSHLNTGLILFNSDRRVRFFNGIARSLLCQPVEKKIEGCRYNEILDPLLVPVFDRLTSSFESLENFSREYRVYLPDGIRCIKCDFYSLPDNETGNIFVLSLEDKTAEDNVRQKLSVQLEETHRYAQAKDNFFANMSHEIRTPINAILGMTYFVKTAVTDPKILEYIRKIESASEILLGVVNDILDFSKMHENKFTLKPENFNLGDIKKILRDLFALKAEQKGLDFIVDFECPDMYLVYGDQFRITQVFINLVSNAVKFTDRGSVNVSLTHETIGNDIILRSTVKDTGCGLSEDDISRLFTDFEQFGKVLVKNQEGTGLGLAISKRLVEMMHGVIWVDSALGKGSSFHFVIVIRKPEATFIQDAPANLPRIVRRSNRVLVVEDNEINSEIAQALLSELSFTVDHAEDGLAAIELCRERSADYYDLILMDIHMPRMNGYDTARVLKKDLALTCPIIAVTATSENNETLEANRDVIAGSLLKPYSPGIFRVLFGPPAV